MWAPARSSPCSAPTAPARQRSTGRCPGSCGRPPAAVLDVVVVEAGYGALPVLRGVTLNVGAGEIVAVLGANGAGKTTLNRTLSGLVRTTAGRILFAGDDITRADPAAIVAAGLAHVPEGRRIF